VELLGDREEVSKLPEIERCARVRIHARRVSPECQGVLTAASRGLIVWSMSEPPRPVARVLDAANRHDSDAFLASFTEDGVVDDWGREFAGTAAIKDWSDREFIGVNVLLDVRETHTTRDGEMTVSAEVGGDGFNGPSHFTFRVRGDLVSRMTIRQ
jgi:hypothetical protein